MLTLQVRATTGPTAPASNAAGKQRSAAQRPTSLACAIAVYPGRSAVSPKHDRQQQHIISRTPSVHAEHDSRRPPLTFAAERNHISAPKARPVRRTTQKCVRPYCTGPELTHSQHSAPITTLSQSQCVMRDFSPSTRRELPAPTTIIHQHSHKSSS